MSWVVSSSGACREACALSTTISSLPNASIAAFTIAAAFASFEISAFRNWPDPVSSVSSALPASSSISTKRTCAPFLVKARTIPRPIPPAPPVTIATFPVSLIALLPIRSFDARAVRPARAGFCAAYASAGPVRLHAVAGVYRASGCGRIEIPPAHWATHVPRCNLDGLPQVICALSRRLRTSLPGYCNGGVAGNARTGIPPCGIRALPPTSCVLHV